MRPLFSGKKVGESTASVADEAGAPVSTREVCLARGCGLDQDHRTASKGLDMLYRDDNAAKLQVFLSKRGPEAPLPKTVPVR